jgi:hypothetical protein
MEAGVMLTRYAVLFVTLFLCITLPANGVVINFGDLDEGTDEMTRNGGEPANEYGPAQGMPSGLTVTFHGFWKDYFPGPFDADESDGEAMSIWGISDEPSDVYIEFSQPVFVTSLWAYNGLGNWEDDGFGGSKLFRIEGSGPNGGLIYDATFVDYDFFFEVTEFANVAVTELRFTRYLEVLLDALTFEPALTAKLLVPEPAALGVLGIASAMLFMRRPLKRRDPAVTPPQKRDYRARRSN